MRAALRNAISLLLVAAALAACDPFGLPSTRALENGATSMLTSATSFEVKGSYRASDVAWTIDLQLSNQPPARRMSVSNGDVKLDAIVLPSVAYFSGQAFLLQFLGGDPRSRDLARAAGNGWWTGPATLVPKLVDLTSSDAFRSTFLGSAITSRKDHLTIDGSDAVELSGPRADVYIASAAPNRLLRLVIPKKVTIDGIGQSDLHYSNYDKEFDLSAPKDVIDFSNLSTLHLEVQLAVRGVGAAQEPGRADRRASGVDHYLHAHGSRDQDRGRYMYGDRLSGRGLQRHDHYVVHHPVERRAA